MTIEHLDLFTAPSTYSPGHQLCVIYYVHILIYNVLHSELRHCLHITKGIWHVNESYTAILISFLVDLQQTLESRKMLAKQKQRFIYSNMLIA